MKLVGFQAKRYRSLLDQDVETSDLNIFIGANASGKSTILDALRFLSEAVLERDFERPMFSRGGMIHLAWKGAAASQVELAARVADGDSTFEWRVRLRRRDYEFDVEERVTQIQAGAAPVQLLESSGGRGAWWSGGRSKNVPLSQSPTSCALAAAAADASFPAHHMARFIARWGFFDPNPFLLRRDWNNIDSSRLDHFGRNLGQTLFRLDEATRRDILEATKAIVGLPDAIEPRSAEDEDRFYFVQQEEGLRYHVHQMGVSSGTLRVLALMTALRTSAKASSLALRSPRTTSTQAHWRPSLNTSAASARTSSSSSPPTRPWSLMRWATPTWCASSAATRNGAPSSRPETLKAYEGRWMRRVSV